MLQRNSKVRNSNDAQRSVLQRPKSDQTTGDSSKAGLTTPQTTQLANLSQRVNAGPAATRLQTIQAQLQPGTEEVLTEDRPKDETTNYGMAPIATPVRPRPLGHPVLQGKLDENNARSITDIFMEKIGKIGKTMEDGRNAEILETAINEYDTLVEAFSYLDTELFFDYDLDDFDALKLSDPSFEGSDDGLSDNFGFYIKDDQVGNIDTSVTFNGKSNNYRNIPPETENAFVGSITSTPAAKGGVAPPDVGKKYRDEGFSKDGAENYLNLVFGINYKADLFGQNEGHVQKEVNSVQSWEDFGMHAQGFLWHQWYVGGTNTVARMTDVRRDYNRLSAADKKTVRGYEGSKKNKIPYGAARSLTFEFTKPVASYIQSKAKNVWVHVADPDSPSLKSRGAAKGGDKEAPSEQMVPVFDQYMEIIKELVGDTGAPVPPTVISGGYEFREKAKGGDVEKTEFLAMIGHRLDLAMRSAIADAAPESNSAANTYLPEPNLLFKWEGFLRNRGDLFGTDVKESINLLKNYLDASSRAAKDPLVRYDIRANVATETAPRFRIDDERESTSKKTTLDEFDPSVLTKEDIYLMVNQSQSYATYETWVIPVAANLNMRGKALLDAFKRCMITEFYAFDPAAIRENIDAFDLPSPETIVAYLESKFTESKEKRTGRTTYETVKTYKKGSTPEAINEIAIQLHQAGRAMIEFLTRVFEGDIPDPVFERSLAKIKEAD